MGETAERFVDPESGPYERLEGDQPQSRVRRLYTWAVCATLAVLLINTSVRFSRALFVRSGGEEVVVQSVAKYAMSFKFAHPRADSAIELVGDIVVDHHRNVYLTSARTSWGDGVVSKAHSVGRLVLPGPVRMKVPDAEMAASFKTTFVFSIESELNNRETTGDGLAFVLMPYGRKLGSSGGYLGVMDREGDSNTLAIEFDTWRNPELQDGSSNHIGINVNSMTSMAAHEAGYWTRESGGEVFKSVDLTSGTIQAWIEYDGPSQELTVSISPELGAQPTKPLLRRKLDLSKIFVEDMTIGFSAATGEFSAKHVIHSWELERDFQPVQLGVSKQIQAGVGEWVEESSALLAEWSDAIQKVSEAVRAYFERVYSDHEDCLQFALLAISSAFLLGMLFEGFRSCFCACMRLARRDGAKCQGQFIVGGPASRWTKPEPEVSSVV